MAVCNTSWLESLPIRIGESTSAANYSRRFVAPAAVIAETGSVVRIKFMHYGTDWSVDDCFIGLGTGSGPQFDGNQVRVTFDGGNNGKTFTAGDVYSDPIDFVLDGTTEVVVSYYSSTAPARLLATIDTGYRMYYATSNTAGLTDPGTMTSTTNRYSGVETIEVCAAAAATEYRSALESLWGDATVNYRSQLITLWSLSETFRSQLISEYGIEMASKLVSVWGNAAVLRAQLETIYHDAPIIRSKLISEWSDALQFRTKLVSVYSLSLSARSSLISEYSIMGGRLISSLESYWHIKNASFLISKLVSTFSILSDESITVPVTLSMTIAGIGVDPEYIGRERHRDQYKVNCEAHFREQYVALLAEKGAEVVITAGDETTRLLVKTAGRQTKHGDRKWVVSMVSASVALEDPDGPLLSGSYGGVLASVLVNQWSQTVGVSITFEVEDWMVPVDAVTASDQQPLSLIRSLLDEARCVLQTDIDGTVVVRYRYETPITELPTAIPDIYLTVDEDFSSIDEDTDDRPGYNRYLITDEAAAGPSVQPGQMECNGITYVTLSVVPWGSYQVVELSSSHSGASIGPREHIVQTVSQKDVEFVAGVASVDHPVYGDVTVAYQTNDLGVVTGDETGALTAAVAGESLADITYQTQYFRWPVDAPETAQLIFRAE